MISRFSRMSFILLSSALVSACATMSAEECKLANWHDVGLRDGLEGKSIAMLDARTKDCAEAKVPVDAKTYLSGRERGLKTYCRMENALPLGLNGGSYEGVCPPWIDQEFRWRFQIGHTVYERRNEVGRLDERIASAERRLSASKHEEEKRLREAKNNDDRKRIRHEIDEQQHRLREELSDLDRQLRRARDQLRDAEGAMNGVR